MPSLGFASLSVAFRAVNKLASSQVRRVKYSDFPRARSPPSQQSSPEGCRSGAPQWMMDRDRKGKHDIIPMGGMATVLKVRDHLKSYEDPGWYDAPKGTMAVEAETADLKRDGIDPDRPPKAETG